MNRDDAPPPPLPVVASEVSCTGCGACCLTQGSPPMYLHIMDGLYLSDDPEDVADRERVANLPPEALATLLAYVKYRKEHRGADDEHPCVWFDHEALGCKWYEHRPSICRDFVMGGRDCLDVRKEAGVGAAPPAPPETKPEG